MKLNPAELRATLHALEQQGRSRLLARPQVTTVNGQPASIFIGDEVPILLKGQGDAPDTIQTITAGVRLEITPFVASDGTITADVKPEVSSIVGFRTAGDQQLPQIRTRKAQTRIRVKDGEPIVIGGLINQQQSEDGSGLPVLKEFPVVGGLFSTRLGNRQQSEMLIFVVPQVVPVGDGTRPGAQADGGADGESPREPGRLSTPRMSTVDVDSAATKAPLGPSTVTGRARVWALRLDLVDAVGDSAWELTVERPVGAAQGAATSLILTPVSDGVRRVNAWGLGLEWRWYHPSTAQGAWIGLGGEVVWPEASVGTVEAGWPLTVFAVEAGVRSPVGRVPILLEPYLRWVPSAWSDTARVRLPRRTPGLWAGLRVGWAF